MHLFSLSPARSVRSPSVDPANISPPLEGLLRIDTSSLLNSFSLMLQVITQVHHPSTLHLPSGPLSTIIGSTFLQGRSHAEILQLSLGANLLNTAVNDYFVNEIIPELTFTIFTSSENEEPDYQHLRYPRLASVQADIPSNSLIVFRLNGSGGFSQRRYPYSPGRFETREIRMRLKDETEYTWRLCPTENIRRGFGRLEGYADGKYNEFHFHKSDVGMSVYYLWDDDRDSLTLEAATITVQCIKNWLYHGPGELV